MKVAICNFGKPVAKHLDFRAEWARYARQATPGRRCTLFEQAHAWGFHLHSLGVYLLDRGLADEVEFWDYADQRSTSYHANGILRVWFNNEHDVKAYLDRLGPPDLFVNHGPGGHSVLDLLDGKCFRVHVPALRLGRDKHGNVGAECYLVDSEGALDDRSMLYIPVVNTRQIYPDESEKERDFIYLASAYRGKRQDLLLDAVRGTALTGHLHPVDAATLDLRGTNVTTSNLSERSVLKLLQTSRIAVYPGDETSNPAAMWECVAAGLPIVVNHEIRGGKHLVVSGVTGELARENEFYDVMLHVLEHREAYRPREYFEEHWDTVTILERYLSFFRSMGWPANAGS